MALAALVTASDRVGEIACVSAAQRLVKTFQSAGVQQVVIAASMQEQARLEPHIPPGDAAFAPDPGACAGPVHLVRSALQNGIVHGDPILIAPLDIPLFSPDTVRALTAGGHAFARPVCEGQPGYPLLVSQPLLHGIAAYRGEGALEDAVRATGTAPYLVEIADPGVYTRCTRHGVRGPAGAQDSSGWRPLVKLQIARDSAFLGPGSWQLLSLVEATGSVSTASKQMGLSYSKAWKILNNLEQQTGSHVLERRQGGKHGGETHLTRQGRALLDQYRQFELECRAAVDSIFARHYGGDLPVADPHRERT